MSRLVDVPVYFMPGEKMADSNNIKVNVNVDSNGSLDAEAKKADRLAASLKNAEQASASTSKTLAAAKKAAGPTIADKIRSEEQTEYGISRAAGGTGAAARDFAKQSQGLGGLVRLYATLAANLFAVSAAYTALSNAADTANLIKGLDQLGAASGRALGTLSKRLTEAADGAISLRDSMESVAKASSAGLSDDQILRLGTSAKQASQALGVDMADALSRLTRGIVKLEPELLDELGIFIRIDDAARAYALSMGKSATALSDFERRQAFANAVLTQAEKKFSEIDLDINPYTKLLATLKDLAFAGLDLVNTVLGPLVKLLSESPAALSTLLGVITAKLVTSAIPALAEWRASLRLAAEDAAETSKRISESFGDTINNRLQSFYKIPNLEKALSEVNAEIERVMAKQNPVQTIPVKLQKSAPSIINAKADEAGLNTVNNLLKKRNEYLETGLRGQTKLTEAAKKSIAEEVSYLKARQAEIIREIELEKLRQKQLSLGNALKEAQEAALTAADRKPGRFDAEALAMEKAKKARLDYDKIQAVSNAAENTRILGTRLAWEGLNREITEKGITGIDKYTTLAKGGLASVAVRVGSIVASFANTIPVAAAAYAAFEILNVVFSKNGKEAAAFRSSVEDTNKSVDVLSDTLDRMAKKPVFERADIATALALSTAISNVSKSLGTLVNTLDKADKKAGWFDRMVDDVLTIVGKDLRSTFTREFSAGITDAFNALPTSEARTALESKLKEIYGVNDISVKSIQDSINSLPTERVVEVNRRASEALEQYSASLTKSSNKLQGFKETLNNSVNAYKEMSASLTSSDPISKLGTRLMAGGTSLEDTLQDTTTAMKGLIELSQDSEKLSLLPENSRNLLIAYSESIKTSTEELEGYQAALKHAERELRTLQEQEQKMKALGGTGFSREEQENVSKQASIKKDIEGYQKSIKGYQESQLSIINEFSFVGREVFRNGVDLLMRQIDAAKKQAAITITKAQTQIATGFAKNSFEASLQKQEIDIQIKLLDVQEALVVAQTKTNLLLAENALNIKIRDRSAEQASGKLTAEGLKELEFAMKEVSDVSAAYRVLSAGLKELDLRSLTPGVARQLGTIPAMAASSTATRIKLGADKAAVDITRRQKDEDEQFNNEQKQLKSQIDLLNIEKARLANLVNISGIDNISLLARKQQAELSIFDKQQVAELAELKRSVAQAEEIYYLALGKGNRDNIASAEKELKTLREQEKAQRDKASANRSSLQVSQEIELIEARALQIQKERAYLAEVEKETNQQKSDELNSSKEFLDYLLEIRSVSEDVGILRKASLEQELLLQQKLTQESSIRREAEASRKTLDDTLAKARLTAAPGAEREAAEAQYLADLRKVDELEQARLNTVNKQVAAKSQLIAFIAKESAQYAKISSIADSIEKSFSGLGSSVENFGKGLANILRISASYSQKRVAQEKDTQKKLEKVTGDSWEDQLEYFKIKERAEKDSKKLELDSMAETAGAAKSMFAEKTVAHKALAAVEKTLHIARLAMLAAEIASNLASVGPTVASETAKSVAKGKGAILSALNAPFPVNFVAGAAMAAIVASLLGGSSGSFNMPSGVSAKDVQEVQGTGYSYVNGKKVENGGGVFGDASAKSESLTSSLELLNKTSVEGLSYSSKMVELLTKINSGINGAAKSLYAIPGIRTGSQFGTEEGTRSSGIKGLFGKSTTKEIVDSGIKIQGLFTDITKGLSGVIKGYETVATTVKKSGFLGIGGSTKTRLSTQYADLDTAVSNEIAGVFENATDLFIEVGGKLGITVEEVLGKLGNIRVDQVASLKGLKGEELASELNAVIGNILDTAAASVFKSMEKYREFGEGMLETSIRVLDANDKLIQSFKSINRTFNEVSYDMSESLVKLAGGLDTLLELTANFKDKYLSEAEQLVSIEKAVTEQLSQLGFASVKTKDDIKFLVNGLDLTTTGGQEAYIQLLKLSDSFDRLAQAADTTDNLRIDLLEAEGKTAEATVLRRQKELKAMSATDAALQIRIWALEDEKDLITDGYGYQVKILQLLGKTNEALVKTRQKELNELVPQMRAVQEYIYAIEDEITARERATGAVTRTIDSLKNSMRGLKDLRSSLLGGDKSILTPQEKYVEAKKQAELVISAASEPADTVEKVLAREAAISKLPDVTSTWLEASRNLYASSAQYTKDFDYVLKALENTSANLESELSDSEKQLQAIKESTNILEAIDINTLKTSDLVKQLLASAEATRLAMVAVPDQVVNPGVQIPNVDLPATTINENLIAELIKFNKEALEKQIKAQQEAAAAIIKANAEAEAAAAAALIAAQKAAEERAAWEARNQPVLDWYNPGGA